MENRKALVKLELKAFNEDEFYDCRSAVFFGFLINSQWP